MILSPPATSRAALLQSLSAALHTTPVMTRLHDPDHALSDETARQLVESLDRLGITMSRSIGPAADAEREIERLRQEQDAFLDEALEETFPASDSIAPGRPHPGRPG